MRLYKCTICERETLGKQSKIKVGELTIKSCKRCYDKSKVKNNDHKHSVTERPDLNAFDSAALKQKAIHIYRDGDYKGNFLIRGDVSYSEEEMDDMINDFLDAR